jgi:uncharacterized protein (TIGR00255 family)
MTAFSRQQLEQDWGSLTWEIRSVNHRYLETSIRLPDTLRGLENATREAVRKRLSRGKVECLLRYQATESAESDLQIDRDLVRKLIDANRQIEQMIGTSTSVSASVNKVNSSDLLHWPGVIQEQVIDTGTLEKESLDLFNKALDDLVANREREGEALVGFLLQRVESIREIVVTIRDGMPAILAAQRKSLLGRVQELKVELEPARLEQEVVLHAQKADVDEELDRLDSHVKEVERVIKTSGQKGRRLDFLMQELNREANTLSSKSIVVNTTMSAVELKVLIEQMREQIQNIE